VDLKYGTSAGPKGLITVTVWCYSCLM